LFNHAEEMAKRQAKARKAGKKRKTTTARARLEADVEVRKENARLRRELTEALGRQKATSAILAVISSSTTELQPILDTIVRTASRMCDAEFALIYKLQDGKYHLAATNNTAEDFVNYASEHPLVPGRGSLIGRTTLEQKPIHLPDCLADPEYEALEYQRAGKYRTSLGVPLQQGSAPVGVIALMRARVKPFTDRQIELVTTFANQAVIAIENARLFGEVKARTDDLDESLQQQTATADVLKVISRSTLDSKPDLEAVLETLLESAIRLCGAMRGHVLLYDGEFLRFAASSGAWPGFRDWLQSNPLRLSRGSIAGRAALDLRVCHVHDVLTDPDYQLGELMRSQTFRSAVCVPMLREGKLLGVIAILKSKVEPFTEKQIKLVSTFADQAVIAIENARLFDEVQARTNDLQESLGQQTATSDVLKLISRSAFDLPSVLQTLIESAVRLSGADKGVITREIGGRLLRSEFSGFSPEFIDLVRDIAAKKDRGTAVGRALLEGVVVHIPDVTADPDYTFIEGQRMGDYRTMLCVPMLKDGVALGTFALTRSEVCAFTDRQIELVTTFADQAAIAIENARLFNEVQAKTRELTQSLEDLRTAQDRLVQTEKLASLGQLTAGIAHEIKNPLNFVNNFSSLSVEIADELNGVLKQASFAQNIRRETDELTRLLKDNLEKVVRHGKRADSIVKNMLLHSRQGSGERRPADINALVDESLNLAYHGARAENPKFNVTLQRDFDLQTGTIEVFPQEITRVLLNLISNGFYAVTKRKADNGEAGFEPVVKATTRGHSDRVEIRIRDNGTGMPPDVREKIFNPFFTTKPAGEGTGLGLSMSHDIVVKQHGGAIEVDTQPGEFTELTVVLPRATVLLPEGS
jgi:two-component system, NtrC family, sensor kinase